jgi:phage terminase small subunit
MGKKRVKAPVHLSEKSKKLWNELVREWDFHPLQLGILQCGLENLDLARVCMARIYKDGLVITAGKFTKPHPLLRTLKEAKTIFLRSMMQLEFGSGENPLRKEVESL